MFNQRLKDLRKEKKITQDELGKFLHVSGKTIGAWERGTRQPNLETVNILADFFNVSTDYLLGKSKLKQSPNDKNVDPIDKMLDEVMSYDGRAPSENDREVLRGIIQAYLKNKK